MPEYIIIMIAKLLYLKRK